MLHDITYFVHSIYRRLIVLRYVGDTVPRCIVTTVKDKFNELPDAHL